MRHISIYGAGHLSKSLLTGLKNITDQQISLYNRNPDKAIELIAEYSNLNVVSNSADLAKESSIIFIIIPPTAIIQLDQTFIEEVKSSNSILVSCANYLTVSILSNKYPEVKIIRLLPNILWQIRQGVSIYSTNSLINTQDVEEFSSFLSPITTLIKAYIESDFDNLGKLTSCGPGIFANLLDQIFSSFKITSLEQQAGVLKTLAATIGYSTETKRSFSDIIIEVANEGGLTESGIAEMNNLLPSNFAAISLSMDKRLSEKKIVFVRLLQQPTWGFAILGQDVVIFIFSNMAAVVRAGQASVGFWFLSCTFILQSAAVPGLTFNEFAAFANTWPLCVIW